MRDTVFEKQISDAVNSFKASVAFARSVTATDEPITVFRLRKLAKSLPAGAPATQSLLRFLELQRLFHPLVAMVLSQQPVDFLTKAKDEELSLLFRRLGLSRGVSDVEVRKADAFRKPQNGTPPTELEFALEVRLPSAAAKELRAHNAFTFADARRLLFETNKLNVADRWGDELDARARFSVFTDDLAVTKSLYQAGQRTVRGVATMDNREVKALAGTMKRQESELREIRIRAQLVQQKIARTSSAVYQRRYDVDDGGLGKFFGDLLDDKKLFPDRDKDLCEVCDDCHSAVSLTGYLIDLIEFSAHHYAQGFVELDQILYRDLQNLVIDCTAQDERLSELQLSSEVLERFLIDHSSLTGAAELRAKLRDAQIASFASFEDSMMFAVGQVLNFPQLRLKRYLELIKAKPSLKSYHRGTLRRTDLKQINGIDDAKADSLFEALVDNGYINAQGTVSNAFRPEQAGFNLNLPAGFGGQETDILELVETTRGNHVLGMHVSASGYADLVSLTGAGTIKSEMVEFLNDRGIDLTTWNFIDQVKRRQLVARWKTEDALLPDGHVQPSRKFTLRYAEQQRVVEECRSETRQRYDSALSDYFQTLIAYAESVTNRRGEDITNDLLIAWGGDSCVRRSRLEEAVAAVRQHIQNNILRHTDTDRPVEDGQWDLFQDYQTWRGQRLPRFYPELFHDLTGELLIFASHRGVPSDRLEVHSPAQLLDACQHYLTHAESLATTPGHWLEDGTIPLVELILSVIWQVIQKLDRNEYQSPDELRQLLSGAHRLVWSALPINIGLTAEAGGGVGPVVAEERRVREWNQALKDRAKDPATITSIALCDWLQLQQETLGAIAFLAEIGGLTDDLADYGRRANGGDKGTYFRGAAGWHWLAFYVLPRLWGQLHQRIEAFEEAIRFYHLVYNETVIDYAVTIRVGMLGGTPIIDSAPPITQVIYGQLRRFNPNPWAKYVNQFDTEIKDMRLLIGRTYVEWAELEFRKDDAESRALSISLFRNALRLFDYSETGDDRLSCENPCENRKLELAAKLRANLGRDNFNALSHDWNRATAQIRQESGYKELENAIDKVVSRGGVEQNLKTLHQALIAETGRHTPLRGKALIDRGHDFSSRFDDRLERGLLGAFEHGYDADLSHGVALIPDPSGRGTPPLPGGGDIPLPDGGGIPGFDPVDRWLDDMFDRPMEDLPNIPEPDQPQKFGRVGYGSLVCAGNPVPMPSHVKYQLCVPENPLVQSLVQRACVGLRLIRECRNLLGYRHDFVPLFRFTHLIQMAQHFATLAQSAEKDFIAFTSSSESEVLSLLKETQALHVADGTLALNRTLSAQAIEQMQLAGLQKDKLIVQQTQIDDQLLEGATDLEERALQHLGRAQQYQEWAGYVNAVMVVPGMVAGGAGGAAVGSFIAPVVGTSAGAVIGAGITGAVGGAPFLTGALSSFAASESTHAQIAQLQNSIEQRLDELGRAQELIEEDLRIADKNISIADIGVSIAQQQAGIAAINARFAADIVHFLRFKFLSTHRWAWMANIAKENYRTLLNYAITSAWLAERALEFERQRELNLIRFDYWRKSEQGLMGVDQLVTDMASLQNEKLVNEQRKMQVTRTLSLAQIAPLELELLRETGAVSFTFLEEWFERDFPTHYLRLIKGVSVNVAALTPPTEAIKASLTQLGTTRTRIKRGNAYQKHTIRRPPERIALSSPLQATGRFLPLFPETNELNPFEGSGVEGAWIFEMNQASNPGLNFRSIADIQFVVHYTALDDPAKLPVVPMTAQGAATYTLHLHFPDEFYHFKNPIFYAENYGFGEGETPPPYTLQLTVNDRVLAPNQINRTLRSVTVLFQSKEGRRKRPYCSLIYRSTPEGTGTVIWQDRVPNESGLLRAATPSVEAVPGIWELSFLADETAWKSAMGLSTTLPTNFDADADSVAPFNLFNWETNDAGEVVPRKENGHANLDLSWLNDILIMLEYDYVTAAR